MDRLRLTTLALSVLTCAGAGSAGAGELDWSFAIEAGGNLARFGVSPSQDGVFDDRNGFYAGASLARSSGIGGVRLGVWFVRKGTEIPDDPETITWNALEAPLLFELHPSRSRVRPVVFAGAALSHRLSVRSSQFPDDTDDDVFDDVFVGTDVGAVVGAGLEIDRVALESRYTWGLRNLIADGSEGSLKSRVWSFGARLRF